MRGRSVSFDARVMLEVSVTVASVIDVSASALLQGFVIFCSFGLVVVFSRTIYLPGNNPAALFTSTSYNEIVND